METIVEGSKTSAAPNLADRLEKVPVLVFEDPSKLAVHVAKRVANLIEEQSAAGDVAVLGLPTGSTPIGVYRELVKLHKEQGLDFSNVVTFNLDEYYPIKPDSIQSYHRFMNENFFDHVNIPKGNIHIPSGEIPRDQIHNHCFEYERKIKEYGGIDLLLLGIGRSGHIGFNEPGSTKEDRTRSIVLDEITRKDAASDFFEEKYVPREAITMGVGTILESKEIILIATGEHKAPILKRAVEGEITESVSATFLQTHPNASFFVDKAAASELTREKTPWMVMPVEWTEKMAKRAVVWLSQKQKKAIGQLQETDFHENHLHDLVHSFGNIDSLCKGVFEDLRVRIKSNDDLPQKKKIIVFSPHPDDDVISMGGMLGKLVENQNDVTVAYMTNGSVAVFDDDVFRHLRFLEMAYKELDKGDDAHIKKLTKPLFEFLDTKQPAQVDTEEIQNIKAYIRYTEAIAGIEVMGLSYKNALFLDMPFYKTGLVKKNDVSAADIKIIKDLFEKEQPDHIYVAGDLSDPHGTHRLCYSAIKQGLKAFRSESNDDESKAKRRAPLVWLYRGAWQEWEIDQADCFVPLTRADLKRKIEAIFKHESQKDRALFPGAYDKREFWQRAKDRNRDTAQALDELGLPEFHAAEAYVVTTDMP